MTRMSPPRMKIPLHPPFVKGEDEGSKEISPLWKRGARGDFRGKNSKNAPFFIAIDPPEGHALSWPRASRLAMTVGDFLRVHQTRGAYGSAQVRLHPQSGWPQEAPSKGALACLVCLGLQIQSLPLDGGGQVGVPPPLAPPPSSAVALLRRTGTRGGEFL